MTITHTHIGGNFNDLLPRLSGELILPEDASYNQARQVWNGEVDKSPAAIVRCANIDDVIHAVRWASANDLKLSVRGGGHDFAGRSLRHEGVVIDCSPMTAVSIDSKERTARAQGGATIGHLIGAAQQHGLATATGTISSVGLGGLTLAGGYGPLLGKCGLVSDNLLSAQVVNAKGELLTASETEHPDLYWGLRGGGGNFGVVVSLEYRLYPISNVLAGLLLYPMEQARIVLREFNTLSWPDELTVQTGFISTPDGTPMLMFSPTYCGPLKEGEKALEPLRKVGKPQHDGIQPIAYDGLIRSIDVLAPAGRSYFIQTRSLDHLDEETIEILIERARQFSSPFSMLAFHHFHGAASRVAVGETAFGMRQDHLMMEIISAWDRWPGEGDEKHLEWGRHTSDALAPYALPGGYVNLLDDTEHARIPHAFGPNYERLVNIKRRYDPDDVFDSTVGHVSPRVSVVE